MLKIACMTSDAPGALSGCGYYRMSLPYSNFTTNEVDIFHNCLKAFTQPMIDELAEKMGLTLDTKGTEKEYDVFVFQRVFDKFVTLAMAYLRDKGKIVVQDMDDDFLDIPKDNPAWLWMHPMNPDRAHDITVMKQSLAVSSLVTVTTKRLQTKLSQFNENVEIIGNYIDINNYPEIKREKKRRIVVGWCGSITHVGDLKIVKDALERLAHDHTQVVVGIGGDQRVFYSLNIADSQKIYYPEVSMENYPKMVQNFDIGIVPLADNEFNKCKSNLKGKEMMACSLPVVASNTPDYVDLIDEGVDGFIADYGKRFYPLLEKLVLDQDLRLKMSENARRKAVSNDIRANVYRWERLYAP